jgi:hypothetical protein
MNEEELAHWALTLLANVSEGDWSQQTPEWRAAARRYFEAYHARARRITEDFAAAERHPHE